jgi:hypothetical protein
MCERECWNDIILPPTEYSHDFGQRHNRMIDAVLLFKEEKSFLTSADMLNIEKGQKGNYWIKMLVSFIRTAAKVIADTVGKYETFHAEKKGSEYEEESTIHFTWYHHCMHGLETRIIEVTTHCFVSD